MKKTPFGHWQEIPTCLPPPLGWGVGWGGGFVSLWGDLTLHDVSSCTVNNSSTDRPTPPRSWSAEGKLWPMVSQLQTGANQLFGEVQMSSEKWVCSFGRTGTIFAFTLKPKWRYSNEKQMSPGRFCQLLLSDVYANFCRNVHHVTLRNVTVCIFSTWLLWELNL